MKKSKGKSKTVMVKVARNDWKSKIASCCEYVISLTELRESPYQTYDYDVDWLGTPRGTEVKVCPKYFHKLTTLRLKRGEGPVKMRLTLEEV